jgi:hypothetical protein
MHMSELTPPDFTANHTADDTRAVVQVPTDKGLRYRQLLRGLVLQAVAD